MRLFSYLLITHLLLAGGSSGQDGLTTFRPYNPHSHQSVLTRDSGSFLPISQPSASMPNDAASSIDMNFCTRLSGQEDAKFWARIKLTSENRPQLLEEPSTADVRQANRGGLTQLSQCLVFAKHYLNPSLSEKDAPRAAIHRPLPESLTSFGAAVMGEYLYVFSGHSGDAHGFGKDLLVDHFRRIRFDDPTAQWEELAMHEPAQSTALVTDNEHIYRIGGLSFLNSRQDEPTNFNSTDHFARYDVKQNKWTELAPLPSPRSSLDAAILGRSIYVAGGWNLQGESSSDVPWHEDILRFDLDDPGSGWRSIEGPGYLARAISLAAHNDKLYMIGGIQQRGITRKVSVYDPATEQWSEGPELNADNMMSGFATSSFAVGGCLYVTGGSGIVYRLSTHGQEWEVADRLLFPRMFLRMLPVGEDRLIALGGTGLGGVGRMATVESLSVQPYKKNSGKLVKWSIPFDGRAKHSQTLVVQGSKLYAFGGNASRSPHDFSENAFVDEAFAFDLSRRSVEQLPNMPSPVQSSAGAIAAQTSEHSSIVVAGGLAFGDTNFGSTDQIFQFDPETKVWSVANVSLPRPRAMFDAQVHEDAIWMFGGSDEGDGAGLDGSVLHWWGDDSLVGTLPKVEIPVLRRSFGGAIVDGKYYMVGGLGEGMSPAESLDVFDLETRSWQTAASPPKSRVFPSVCTLDRKIYVYGGFEMREGHFASAASMDVYDTESDTWSTAFDNLDGLAPSMRMVAFNGRLLFYAVHPEKEGVANFALYLPDPTANAPVVEGLSFGPSQGSEADQNARLLMRKDTDKSGDLSREELGKRMATFAKEADTNGDLLVSFQEAKEAFAAAEAQAETDDTNENDTDD